MMNIFESLENLNVSEECFDEIMGIVEEYINELDKSTIRSYIQKRGKEAAEAKERFNKAKIDGTATRDLLLDYLRKTSKAENAREKGGRAINYSAQRRHEAKKNLEEWRKKYGSKYM